MGIYKGLDGEDDRRDERESMTQSYAGEERTPPGSLILENGEEVWVVRRGGKKGLPGLESQALGETAAGIKWRMDSSTVEKKAPLQRYRCGSEEHSLRTCPGPFPPVLAFPPKNMMGEGFDSHNAMMEMRTQVLPNRT